MTTGNGCCVLVPALGSIEPECERGLSELARRGYTIRALRGASCIDQVRSLMATEALEAGFTDLMWIDADIGFDPDDVDKLRAHPHDFVCGLYVKKGAPELSCKLWPSTHTLVMGEGGGLIRIQYAAMGFTLTRACVYRAIAGHISVTEDGTDDWEAPECRGYHGRPMLAYFRPVVVGDEYLGEDYAFSYRADALGVAIMADTSIRLYHYGRHAYGWEDLAGVQRTAGVRLDVGRG